MKVLYRVGVVLLVAMLSILPAIADKAKSLYEKGADAEARQNYEAAYEAYRQAYELKPKDLRFRAAYERAKFQAGAAHVHRGQGMREDGKLQEALAEFEAALKIDPSSFIAQTEARRTREMIDQANHPSQRLKTPGVSERLSQAGAPVELTPIADTPINLKIADDSKVVYEAIGKLAGLNVLFDPDYTSRRIKIELNGVTLNEALDIVELESKTFWRAVTPNTIYVATDSKSKRQEVEPQVLKTFYVSNLSSTGTDINDLTNVLRTVLEMQRIVPIPSQGAVVVRGSADQVALAEKVVNDLDKAKSEVVVDVMVMEVSRDKTRNLGISPPTSQGNPSVSLQNSNAATTTDSNGNTTTSGTTGSTNLTLNSLAHLNATNFAVSIPSANVAFLMSDSNTKVLQSPQVRALDGQKASLKIGNRIPIATGSFGGGLGGIGTGSLLTQTQFQYIDVGVNVDVTPHVHANRDVSLKVVLEVSSVTGQSTIGGISQPIIGQRKMENEIRLKEGEANLLGGIFEESDSVSMSGLPWLSQIPLLKYIFGQQNVTRNHNEIVLVLVPHVVRGQDLTDLNHRTLDIGTQNAIGLRRVVPASNVVPATQPKQQSSTGSPPPQAQTPSPTAPQQAPVPQPPPNPGDATRQAGPMGGNAILSFDPPTINQAVGAVFAVNITLTGGQNVFSVPAQVTYDPKLLQVANVSNGNALSKDGQIVALVHREDTAAGSIQLTATRPPGASGIAPEGVVFTLTFIAKAAGQGTLAINRSVLRDPAMNSMPASGSQAVVTIR